MSDPRMKEFRAAAGALVDNPLITTAEAPEVCLAVRRYAGRLNEWFSSRAGWSLQDHVEFVRLVKAPAHRETSHGLPWVASAADYELVVWVLWYAEHLNGRKFLISQFMAEVRERAMREDGTSVFDWSNIAQRRAAKRVFENLEVMGVLRLRDGSAEDWAEETGKRDSLYEWGAVTWNLHLPVATADIEVLAQAGDAASVMLDRMAAGPGPEMRLYRTLLLNTACFRYDDAPAFAVLADPAARSRITHDIAEHLGWELEFGSSFVRLLRPPKTDESVQTPIPIIAHISHPVLLLCGALRGLHASGQLRHIRDDVFAVDTTRLQLEIATLQKAHSERWSNALTDDSVRKLSKRVIAEMKHWGLLRGPTPSDEYLVMPTTARLAAHYLPGGRPASAEEAN